MLYIDREMVKHLNDGQTGAHTQLTNIYVALYIFIMFIYRSLAHSADDDDDDDGFVSFCVYLPYLKIARAG